MSDVNLLEWIINLELVFYVMQFLGVWCMANELQEYEKKNPKSHTLGVRQTYLKRTLASSFIPFPLSLGGYWLSSQAYESDLNKR